jgi:hypothetical protein
VEHGKKFLIIGNKNAITYKETFPLIRDNNCGWALLSIVVIANSAFQTTTTGGCGMARR